MFSGFATGTCSPGAYMNGGEEPHARPRQLAHKRQLSQHRQQRHHAHVGPVMMLQLVPPVHAQAHQCGARNAYKVQQAHACR